MTTNHMLNDKSSAAVIVPTGEKPSIKIRRLSGDTLSMSSKLVATALSKTSNVTITSVSSTPQPAFVTPTTTAGSTLKISNVFSLGEQSRQSPSVANQMALPKTVSMPTNARNVLKPWSQLPCKKTEEICSTMMANLSLYSLFKCMAIDCHFSNSSAETMLQHLRYHVMRTVVPPATKASWLECAYCDDSFDRYEVLVSHVVSEHSTSIFQCPYCFYRACAAHNVLLHIKNTHGANEPLVLVCRGKAKMLTCDLPVIFAARDTNVKAIKCSKGKSIYNNNTQFSRTVSSLSVSVECKSQFFILESYRRHLATHRHVSHCTFCHAVINASNVIDHMLGHNIGIYECVYCNYATNSVQAVREHMCLHHPNKLLYIVCRVLQEQVN